MNWSDFDFFDKPTETKEIEEYHIDDNHIAYSSKNQYSDITSTSWKGFILI